MKQIDGETFGTLNEANEWINQKSEIHGDKIINMIVRPFTEGGHTTYYASIIYLS